MTDAVMKFVEKFLEDLSIEEQLQVIQKLSRFALGQIEAAKRSPSPESPSP